MAGKQRHEIVDIFRGFALIGVLLSNILWTTQHFALTEDQRSALPFHTGNLLVEALSLMFVEFKFYTIFSILFGLGFAIQLDRLQARGSGAAGTFARRLTVLLAIGLTHSVFIWFGDILQFYALLGFVLLLVRNRSDRFLLRAAIGIGLLVALMPALHAWLQPAVAETPDPAPSRFVVMSSGSYVEIIGLHWKFQVETYINWTLEQDGLFYWNLSVLWKFLLGYWIGRKGIFQRVKDFAPRFRRWLPWLWLVGLTGNGILAGSTFLAEFWIPAAQDYRALLWAPVELGVVALSFAYLFSIALWFRTATGRKILGTLAPVGRMALTGYLSQSALYLLLFYGVGFGLLGRLGAGPVAAIATAIFLAQMLTSALWLRRFRYGPMEWIWRCLTYGKLLTIRREASRG
ncbi:hypothetical protein ABI59_21100 [Acidobacteria bacterium Mor1]|nr:hypothetical protein ABI59_21100 [Acidobacteria bacterium Mor1]